MTSDAINAIEFVIRAAAAIGTNVRTLSNSWSAGSFSQTLLNEIDEANMMFIATLWLRVSAENRRDPASCSGTHVPDGAA